MKKVAIIEDCDYDLILEELNVAKDYLKSMRKTRNSNGAMRHIDNAIDILTGECSSTKDIKHAIDDARSAAIVDWR